MKTLPLAATVAFALWGVLHIVGAAAILSATLGDGPGAGYAIYGHDGSPLPAATGAILSYFAYLIGVAGLGALAIALTLNRRNSDLGLALNTAMIVAVEIGLVLFLLIPGHLPFLQALPGFALMAAGVILGGMACNGDPAHAQ